MLPILGWRYSGAQRGFSVAPAKYVPGQQLLFHAFNTSISIFCHMHTCMHSHTHTCKHLPQPVLLPPNCSSSCTRWQAGKQTGKQAGSPHSPGREQPLPAHHLSRAPAPLLYLLRPVPVGTCAAAAPAKGKESAHSFWRKPIHAVCSAERAVCGSNAKDEDNIPAHF